MGRANAAQLFGSHFSTIDRADFCVNCVWLCFQIINNKVVYLICTYRYSYDLPFFHLCFTMVLFSNRYK